MNTSKAENITIRLALEERAKRLLAEADEAKGQAAQALEYEAEEAEVLAKRFK